MKQSLLSAAIATGVVKGALDANWARMTMGEVADLIKATGAEPSAFSDPLVSAAIASAIKVRDGDRTASAELIALHSLGSDAVEEELAKLSGKTLYDDEFAREVACIVMAYIVMAYSLYSYGLYSYGLYSYGL